MPGAQANFKSRLVADSLGSLYCLAGMALPHLGMGTIWPFSAVPVLVLVMSGVSHRGCVAALI